MNYKRKLNCSNPVETVDDEFGNCITICKSNAKSNIFFGLFMLVLGCLFSYVVISKDMETVFRIVLFIVAALFFGGAYIFFSSLNDNVVFFEYGIMEKAGSKVKKKIAYDDMGEITLEEHRVIGKYHSNKVVRWDIKDHDGKLLTTFDPTNYINLHSSIDEVGRCFQILTIAKQKGKENAVM